MARPSLSPQMAARIIDYVRSNDLPRGHHLPGQILADALRVSRAPIAAALRQLEELELVRSEPNRGYFLVKGAEDLSARDIAKVADQEPEDDIYFTIADDRLSQKLADRVSENELMRLYDLPRSRLLKILHRIAEEGWVERLPGNGWAFRPIVTSREGYEQGYQFRAAIESQALLLPTFKADTRAFAAAREEQQAMLDGAYKRMSRAQLFRANSEFHEMLVACSHNEYFVEAVKRVNRLRRLVEYRITLDRSRLPQQCREHLRILDLIEAGDQVKAGDFLRTHILGASAIKSPKIG
jgi:DNA-binding GntR family transcriptional regulator